MWSPDSPQGYESRKIKYILPRYARGRVLEIGCGLEKAYPFYVGYDQFKGAADILGDARQLSLFADEAFDTIFSSHVLEDMEDMGAVLNEWARVLKDGGNLILYLPSANFYPKTGQPGANPNHKHDIYPEDIPELFAKTGYNWEQVVLEERGEGNEYSIFAVYRKECVGCGWVDIYPRPEKTACVFRTGGFGDILIAASILPGLKKEGYHVSFITSSAGADILKNNPYVDEIIPLDLDGLMATDLFELWEANRPRFDKWINLQNSLENALLTFPNTVEYHWPESLRRERFNGNYTEFVFQLAELPMTEAQTFFPTEAEMEKAWRTADYDSFNIMFCLAGSTLNKKTPHQDTVIGAILHAIPEAKFFLVADERHAYLEDNWRDNPRVDCLSGKLSLRDTLTLAGEVDVVIGPETGVLNAICYKNTAKVIYLSHSSHENLTKHWKNVYVLEPSGVSCYPCHKLHYKPDTCKVDPETGAAMCVDSIRPEEFITAIVDVYNMTNLPQKHSACE